MEGGSELIRGLELFGCNVTSERFRGDASEPFRDEAMLNGSEGGRETINSRRRYESLKKMGNGWETSTRQRTWRLPGKKKKEEEEATSSTTLSKTLGEFVKEEHPTKVTTDHRST
ncbi:hypothetical protein QVD17_18849 [Tagetes erecta]|uniref:Uncharacterized protein n=1 Tax=Tagetes erecta TaxID=13708 RepID=A0AAD8KIF6_TARER|nr:hypothetical protein QVD17_18849 [Tagetes erecta]